MRNIQKLAAAIALAFVTIIVGLTVFAIWFQANAVEDLLSLTELVLSWPVAAAGLVFGGGQAFVRAWKKP